MRAAAEPFTSLHFAPYFLPPDTRIPTPATDHRGAPGRLTIPGARGVNPIEAFETLDLRVGRVVRVEPNDRARKPAYKLWIDFGPLGEKTSSAQLRALYTADELLSRL